MVAPFALFFGIKPWEMDRLEHRDFLGLEELAKTLMRRDQQGRPAGRPRTARGGRRGGF